MATSVTLKPNAIDISGSTSGTTTLQASAVAGTTTLTLPAATDTLVGKATTDTLTNKTLTGAAMNGTLGATTPSTASVTTLTTSSTVTHSGGTANGVAYLDGSKVLTTGSALVFDGTNLGVGVTPSAWGSGYKALQINNGGIVTNTGGTFTAVTANAYFDGTNYKYISTAAASLYRQNAGVHDWQIASSGTAGNAITFTQAMTLDASGQLGIGTSSPSAKLHVAGTAIKVDGSSTATINLNGSAYGMVSASADLYVETAGSGNQVIFRKGGTETCRITSGGDLLVGTTSTAPGSGNVVGVAVSGLGYVSASRDSVSAEFNRIGSNGDSIVLRRAGAGVGSISVTTTATAYNTSSDYRLKNITGPITTSGAYIDSLNPVEGTWKADGSTFVGLIAHEVQEASRTTVATGVKDGEEMQGMDYSNSEIIANLIAEVKSLRARVAAIESN